MSTYYWQLLVQSIPRKCIRIVQERKYSILSKYVKFRNICLFPKQDIIILLRSTDNPSRWLFSMKIGWKIKRFQFWNFTCVARLCWVYLRNIRDIGYLLTYLYYCKLSVKSVQRKKRHENWLKKKNSIYPPNIGNFWIGDSYF